ncbi:hypothetical protein HID58_037083, partial [Brassica napus]
GTSVWNQPLLRQTFTPEDVQRILLIKPCVNQEDSVYNSNEGDSNTRSVFPWLVWELWKARNALAFENKTVTAYTIASRAFEEASSWQKTMILKSNTEI